MNLGLDPTLEKDVEKILESVGLSKQEAIKIFFQEIKNKGHFNEMKKYNQETLKAIEETDAGKNVTTYKNKEEMFKTWREEAKHF